ncbi:MAG: ROK family protein [bacterium]
MYYIGIDLGGTNLRAGAVAEDGHIIYSKIEPTCAEQGVESVTKHLINCIDHCINHTDSITTSHNSSKLKGIGIGCPGIIDMEKGIIHVSPNLPGWHDVPLKKLLEERFKVPVYVENDANTVAFGEKAFGAGRNASSLVCLTLGTGIGGGIILDGKIWHGCKGMAGEVGHMTIIHDGIRCNCGNRGCLEAYASATALVNFTVDSLKQGDESILSQVIERGEEITAEIIYKAAMDRDSLSLRLLQQTGRYLGIGIATLINLLNPEMIILGGGMAHSWDMFYPAMAEEIKERAFDIPAASAQIVKAQLGNDAGILGAAALIAQAVAE